MKGSAGAWTTNVTGRFARTVAPGDEIDEAEDASAVPELSTDARAYAD